LCDGPTAAGTGRRARVCVGVCWCVWGGEGAGRGGGWSDRGPPALLANTWRHERVQAPTPANKGCSLPRRRPHTLCSPTAAARPAMPAPAIATVARCGIGRLSSAACARAVTLGRCLPAPALHLNRERVMWLTVLNLFSAAMRWCMLQRGSATHPSAERRGAPRHDCHAAEPTLRRNVCEVVYGGLLVLNVQRCVVESTTHCTAVTLWRLTAPRVST
jgi:hypothetical protein